MPIPMTVHFRSLICSGWLVACATLHLQAAEPTQSKPLEPVVASASNDAAQTMQGIKLPSHWRIELYAAEPDVANVVSFDVDHRGRVFVCESFRQNRGVTDNREHDDTWLLADLASETVQDRIDYHKELLGDDLASYTQQDDRIRRLEDTDGDGRVDVSTILANGFNRIEEGTGASILVRGPEIYFTCIPKLWKLVDADDDGQADQKLPLSDGYGVRVAFRGHDLHGLLIGPDGRLYFSIGDRGYHIATDDGRLLSDPNSGAVFRCELDGSGLEVFATGMRNPQELAFNDLGDLFSVDNNSDSGDRARIIHILQGGDTGWRMYYQYLPDRGPFNRDRIWEPLHDNQPAYIVPPITNFSDGPSGLTYYPGTGFGDSLTNRFLLCDFRGTPGNSGVRSFRLDPQGAFYSLAEDDQPIWSVLATDLAFAPDGSLLVSDWVSGWDGVGKGRIYRITDPNYKNSPMVKQVSELLAGDWTSYEASLLQSNLAHPDRRIRLESQWELARRADSNPLIKVATDPEAESTARRHAMWGADQIARQHADQTGSIVAALSAVLSDPDPTLRAAAVKIMGERSNQSAIAAIRPMLADPSARVRYFATLALADLRDAASLNAVVRLIEQSNNQDPALRHAGVMFLASIREQSQVLALADHNSVAVRRAAVVAMRRTKNRDVARFLADENPLVAVEAARAIHDVPIPAAMPALADTLERPSENAELVRRALNANLHLGNEKTAAKVAAYAARDSAPPAMRLEALDVLAHWTSNDPRDRVLGAHRPLSKRVHVEATKALEQHVDSLLGSTAEIRAKTIAVASQLRVQKIAPVISLQLNDQNLDVSLRASALIALSHLQPASAVQFAKTVSLKPVTDLTFAAVHVLSNLDRQASVTTFIEATKSRNRSLRQQAWDVLAKVDSTAAAETIAAAVESYLDGSLPPDVHLNVLQAAQGKLSPDLQQQLDAKTETLGQEDPLGPWLTSLVGGDVERGKNLFFQKTQLSCVRCHKVGLTGGDVGPNLTKIAADKDQRYLLESICLPNATIAKGFETTIIADDAGSVFTGIIQDESDEFVDLMQADGQLRRIAVDQIVARRKGTSAMPADLVKQISLRELRDLVAYLASLN